MNSASPILVVGAGTTGMTMACELARHGAAVRIVDRLPRILPFARATALHSRTLEVFQDLGIVDEVVAQGQPVHGMRLFGNGEEFLHSRYEGVDSPFPFTMAIEQFKTEAILEDLLARFDLSIERETELVAVSERIDGVQATLRHANGREEVVETPWLAACDGAHSRVRHMNRQNFPGEVDPRQYLIADTIIDGPIPADEWCTFMTDSGTLFAFPLPGGRTLIAADVPEYHDAKTERPGPGELQTLVDERGPQGTLVRDTRWTTYFRIHYRVTPHYRHGRTLLAGDAAHIHSLIGGQGMNTGIQDAYNLAWKLALVARGRAPESLIDSYEKERRAIAADVVNMTQLMTEKLEVFRDLPDAERERAYRHVIVPEPERKRMQRHVEELDLDYRRSPICAEHRGSGMAAATFDEGPHAGAQAPDTGALFVDDAPTTLYELLRGPRHALLLFAGAAGDGSPDDGLVELGAEAARTHGEEIDVFLIRPDAQDGDPTPGIRTVGDPERELHGRYGAGGECLYLIRPDGHVGFRSMPVSLAGLRDYLGRVLS